MSAHAMADRNPFVFVVGCPRSGTTLLQRMLDAHTELAVANDTHFIPRAVDKLAPDAFRDPVAAHHLALTEEWVEWVRGYRRFPRLGLEPAAVERAARAAETYAGFVSALYAEFARAHGKPLGGEKTPDYVRSLPLLHSLFPRVKTVHIVRDGRDVALSTLEWATESKGPGRRPLWREEPVAVCALWWRWQVESGLRDAASLPAGHYCEVRYEALVQDPREALRAVTDFLELPFAEEMLAFNEGKVRDEPGLSAKKAWLPPTPGLRDWRSEMDARSLELFEALAGDLLTELGYPRRFSTISPAVAATARSCEERWDA